MNTPEKTVPPEQRLFAYFTAELQLMMATHIRQDWQARNPDRVSPPAEGWRAVLQLANPMMVIDQTAGKVYVAETYFTATDLQLQLYLYDRAEVANFKQEAEDVEVARRRKRPTRKRTMGWSGDMIRDEQARKRSPEQRRAEQDKQIAGLIPYFHPIKMVLVFVTEERRQQIEQKARDLGIIE